MRDIDDLELHDLVQNQVPDDYHHNFWYALFIMGGWKWLIGTAVILLLWFTWFE
jgi:hypothetical protein